jgi:hypothetical protein
MQNHHRAGLSSRQSLKTGRVRLITTHPYHWTLLMPAPGHGERFEVVAEIWPDYVLTKAADLLDEALIAVFAERREMPLRQICIWQLPVPNLTMIAPLVDVRLRHRVLQCDCPYCGKIHSHGAEGGGGHRHTHCGDTPGYELMV